MNRKAYKDNIIFFCFMKEEDIKTITQDFSDITRRAYDYLRKEVTLPLIRREKVEYVEDSDDKTIILPNNDEVSFLSDDSFHWGYSPDGADPITEEGIEILPNGLVWYEGEKPEDYLAVRNNLENLVEFLGNQLDQGWGTEGDPKSGILAINPHNYVLWMYANCENMDFRGNFEDVVTEMVREEANKKRKKPTSKESKTQEYSRLVALLDLVFDVALLDIKDRRGLGEKVFPVINNNNKSKLSRIGTVEVHYAHSPNIGTRVEQILPFIQPQDGTLSKFWLRKLEKIKPEKVRIPDWGVAYPVHNYLLAFQESERRSKLRVVHSVLREKGLSTNVRSYFPSDEVYKRIMDL